MSDGEGMHLGEKMLSPLMYGVRRNATCNGLVFFRKCLTSVWSLLVHPIYIKAISHLKSTAPLNIRHTRLCRLESCLSVCCWSSFAWRPLQQLCMIIDRSNRVGNMLNMNLLLKLVSKWESFHICVSNSNSLFFLSPATWQMCAKSSLSLLLCFHQVLRTHISLFSC